MAARHLIWIDLEMTGLNVEQDVILEIATIITDTELNVVAEGPVYAIYQPEHVLQAMDEWNTKQHTQSGLIERVRASQVSVAEAEQQTLDFIKPHVHQNSSPMCGNSICQDRRFLYRYMSTLENYFHYRNLDVSSLKMLVQYWAPKIARGFSKRNAHLALQDIYESIEELRYYRQHCFKEGMLQQTSAEN